MNAEDYISIDGAAARLGVHRSTVQYYVKQLFIKTEKFPLDRCRYIALADFERIKAAKEEAAARRAQEYVT